MEKKKPDQKKKDGSTVPYGTVPGVPPIYHSTVMYRTSTTKSMYRTFSVPPPRETSDRAEVNKKGFALAGNQDNRECRTVRAYGTQKHM